MIAKLFFPSSIGFIIMAIIMSFASWNMTNIWIPITAIFFVLALLTFVIRKMFNSMEQRIKRLEEQYL